MKHKVMGWSLAVAAVLYVPLAPAGALSVDESAAPQEDLTRCANAKIVSPGGSRASQLAPNFQVDNEVAITWRPAGCIMVVQSYQHSLPKPVSDMKYVKSGTRLRIGEPDSGLTEIKIWLDGENKPSDSIWVWIAKPEKCVVEIQSPRAGTSVGAEALVSGEATIPADKYLWVFLHRVGVAVWWPQGNGAAGFDGNRWSVLATFGDERGSQFEIEALVLEGLENQNLEKWYKNGEITGKYPGMKLPAFVSGCTPVRIKVTKLN